MYCDTLKAYLFCEMIYCELSCNRQLRFQEILEEF